MSVLHVLTARRLWILLVALPLATALVYFVAVAADRFVSESVLTVRQANQDQSPLPGTALMLAGINPPSREDTLYLKEYVHSLDLLKRLQSELDLRSHYARSGADVFLKLPQDASQEDFLEYFRHRVEVLYDDVSGLLTVRVQAFDPAFAQALARAILRESETVVNTFSQRIARDQMAFAEGELQLAASRLQAARAEVLEFQNKHKLLDPVAQAQATGVLTSELQATLARQEAELKNALSYLSPDSFQVRALRGQVEATRSQLDAERSRATTGIKGDRLNELAAQFQALSLKAGFAEDSYKLALSASENARIEATRKIKSLTVIEPPTDPQTAEYPRRLYNLVTIFVASLLLLSIVRLILAAVREHAD